MKFSTAVLFLAGIQVAKAFFQARTSPKGVRFLCPTTLPSSVSVATTSDGVMEDYHVLLTNDAEDLAWSIGNWEMRHTPPLGPRKTSSPNALSPTHTSYETMKDALQLIQQAARRMSHGRRDIQDDLVQEGVVALMQAIHHYPTLTRPTESFQQYARSYILLEMTANSPFSAISQSLSSPLPSRMDSVLQLAQRRIQQQLGLQKKKMVSVESTIETHDPDEVTKVFIDQDYFYKMHSTATITTDRSRSSTTTTTTMDKMWDEEDEEQVWMQPAASLKELIVDRDELSPEADVLQTMLRSDVHDFLTDTLNDVERQVVSLHYGLLHGEPLSLRDTAKRMKTTKEFVRSIQEQAIAKLRGEAPHANQNMEPYMEGDRKRSTIMKRQSAAVTSNKGRVSLD